MHGTLDTSVVAGMWKVEDEGGGVRFMRVADL